MTTTYFPARDQSATRDTIKYFRKVVNWNDPNISSGVHFGRLPTGAFLIRASCQVLTVFNAGTTNVLTFGTTSTNANEISGTGDINEATQNTIQSCLASGATGLQLTASGQVDLYAKFAQTGTAASAGQATWVLEYLDNNDQ